MLEEQKAVEQVKCQVEENILKTESETDVISKTCDAEVESVESSRCENAQLLEKHKNARASREEFERQLDEKKKTTLDQKTQKVAALREQLRDLTAHAKTQHRVSKSKLKEEIGSGHMIITEVSEKRHVRRRKRRK